MFLLGDGELESIIKSLDARDIKKIGSCTLESVTSVPLRWVFV